MHLVVISYEFTFSPFSGNGILSRSLVKSLLQLDPVQKVTVLCCRPYNVTCGLSIATATTTTTASSDRHLEPPEIQTDSAELRVYAVELKAEQQWRCLDINCAWRDFCSQRLPPSDCSQLLQDVASCDAALVVDWTGAHAWRLLQERLQEKELVHGRQQHTPMVYFNFRVYSLGAKENHEFYNDMESRALDEAGAIIALSETDRDALQQLLGSAGKCLHRTIHVLVPPLRGDIYQLATSSSSTAAIHQDLPAEVRRVVEANQSDDPRIFVTCIARLGREKQVARFAQFVAETPELWHNDNNNTTSPRLTPLLVGAASDPEYAIAVTSALRNTCPTAIVIQDRFLSARELAAVLAHTRLNVHPCAYEAYGMTIVEAAAFGVPSVILSRHVGALATLGDEAAILVDSSATVVDQKTEREDDRWDNSMMIATIREVLGNPAMLLKIGQRSRAAALAWHEESYGEAVLSRVEALVSEGNGRSFASS